MFRYERKYRIENNTVDQVIDSLNLNAAGFTLRYEDRWVNSIYLDTVGFDALRDNIDGVSNRTKYRVRWYGNDIDQAVKPRLEHKIKQNMVGHKVIEKLESFHIDSIESHESLNHIYQKYQVRPTVLVRYLRSYYESFDHRVRATVDRQLSYFPITLGSLEKTSYEDEAIILEIKYDQDIELEIDEILQGIPYRLSKNSKFVHAMAAFWM